MLDRNETLDMAKELCRMQRSSYSRENHVFLMTCLHPDAQPREIGEMVAKKYEALGMAELSGDRVICMYRRADLGKVRERIALCRQVQERGEHIASVWRNGAAVDWSAEFAQIPEHEQGSRLLLLVLTEYAGELMGRELVDVIRKLSRDHARKLLQAMRERDAAEQDGTDDLVTGLQLRLEQTRTELRKLQQEMQKRVEEETAREQEQFFLQLNHEEYGQILDQLAAAQAGFSRLREQGKVIPMEIRGVQTLVRCMRQFVSDYGVRPMARIGERMELSVCELEQYLYEGTPFRSDSQRKCVEVVSSGWELPELQTVISYPKVREIAE